MKLKRIIFISLMLLILSMAGVSAADSDDAGAFEASGINDNLVIDENLSSQDQSADELTGDNPSPEHSMTFKGR